ncbi:hypothetical protein ACFWE5_07235 [Cellulosimicrobium funkei]|uniref:hypothetical protein n=1 Tax=Cellulosimicrobium funkei TaxID=264251 RepID=UPI003661A817
MSAHHRTVDRTTQQVVCERIETRVVDLTEPHVESVEQWVRSADGARLEPRRTKIDHRSLLGQLRAGVAGSTQGVSTSGYASKPATNLTPLATLEDIERESAWLVGSIDRRRASRADLRSAVVARLWFLVDRAPTLDDETLAYVDSSVTRWWVRARVTTTWGDPPMKPHVPCADCGRRGGVQVVLFPTAAACTACGAVWDATTIGALGEHVQLALSVSIDTDPRLRPGPHEIVPPIDADAIPTVLGGLTS